MTDPPGRGPSRDSHLSDADANVAWMKQVYETEAYWEEIKFGYRWGKDAPVKDYRQSALLIEQLLTPFIPRKVGVALEIGPGGGRWTAELLRIAGRLHLVDVSETALRVCQQRFRYYDNISYHLTEGSNLDVIDAGSLDLIFSWGALVHVQREHIRNYVLQFARILKPGGVAFIQHPAQGLNVDLSRTDFRTADMVALAEEAGLDIVAQLMTGKQFHPDYFEGKRQVFLDCVSVLQPVVTRV
jgi:SAM-dependent methyltransferase